MIKNQKTWQWSSQSNNFHAVIFYKIEVEMYVVDNLNQVNSFTILQ